MVRLVPSEIQRHTKFDKFEHSAKLDPHDKYCAVHGEPEETEKHIMNNQAPQIVPARIEPPPPNWHVVLCGDCRLTLVAWNGLGRDGWLATLNGPHAADTAAAGTNNTLPNR